MISTKLFVSGAILSLALLATPSGASAASNCDGLLRYEPAAKLGLAQVARLTDETWTEVGDDFLLYSGVIEGPSGGDGSWSPLGVVGASAYGVASNRRVGLVSSRMTDQLEPPRVESVKGSRPAARVVCQSRPGARCQGRFVFSLGADGRFSTPGQGTVRLKP